MAFLVGTAGIPHSTKALPGEDRTSAGIRTIKELGLEAMELEFVEGVYLSVQDAVDVGANGKRWGVVLTAHAPYFLNLGNPQKVVMSKGIILHSVRVADAAGARSLVFHPGYYHKEEPEKTFQIIKNAISDILQEARRYGVQIRVETAGKLSQFGSLEELVKLCKELEGLKICVDFAHIYSRSRGEINHYDGFMRVLEFIWKELGDSALYDMHCHVEGIWFGRGGELKHVNFSESEFDYRGLARALVESGARGVIICESPSLESDALVFKDLLERIPLEGKTQII